MNMKYRGNIKVQYGGEPEPPYKAPKPPLMAAQNPPYQFPLFNSNVGTTIKPNAGGKDPGEFPNWLEEPDKDYTWLNTNLQNTPVNPSPFKTYDISGQTGYTPTTNGGALNNNKTPLTPQEDANAIPYSKDKKKIDPYFALRGVTTGLSWLSGMVDRKRQDQYMYNQYSTLGQLDPSNVKDSQPTRYTPYAQKGGTPIIVNNPNDPRLRAYNDSLRLYNEHSPTYGYNQKNILPILDVDKKAFTDKKTGIAPSAWRTNDSVNNGAGSPYFKKPVQPVVYQSEPQLKNIPYNPQTLPYAQPAQGTGIVSRQNQVPAVQNTYRVEYRDEQGNMTHQDFPNEKMGSEAQRLMSGERQGYYLKKGGKVEKKKFKTYDIWKK